MTNIRRTDSSLEGVVSRTSRKFLTAQTQFIRRYKGAFMTRLNGLSWPHPDQTYLAAQAYFRALPVVGANATMRTLSGSVNVPEDRLQQFITDSPWDHDAVQADLNEDIPPAVRSEAAILQVDGMPILTDGEHSVGVGRQWAGNVGKVANSQHAVDLILTVPVETHTAQQVTWPLGMELYLPKDWLTEPACAARRADARIRRTSRSGPSRRLPWRSSTGLGRQPFPTPASAPTRTTATVAPSGARCATGTNRTYSG